MKVIAFSLWGDKAQYCVGAIRNAELATEIYPDWICRFYVASDVPLDVQSKLASFDHVELCDIPIGMNGWKGMFARFLPACEENVRVMISRDCDSRLSYREKAAVNEWLESDKGFHIMRDHAYHSVPILGGLWGIKFGTVPDFEVLMNSWNHEDRYQTDQEFLAQSIWPQVRGNSLSHDDGFFTHLWGGKPFPTERENGFFTGATYDEYDRIDLEQVRHIYG